MTNSENGIQEKLDNISVIAAGICAGMNKADGERPLTANDAAYVANIADAVYAAIFHKVTGGRTDG